MNKKEVQKLTTGSIYKLVFIGFLFGFSMLFLLFGVMAALDLLNLKWNEQPVTGVEALLVGPLMGLFMAFMSTAIFGSIMALGLWFFSKIRPITVEYYPVLESIPMIGEGAQGDSQEGER